MLKNVLGREDLRGPENIRSGLILKMIAINSIKY
jgi:hypothetical protein